MGFLADRAVRHGPRLETLHDRFDRLDFVDWNWVVSEFQVEESAQSAQSFRLVVDQLAVLLEDLVIAGAASVLELVNGLRVEQMVLAVTAPLILTPGIKQVAVELAIGKSPVVPNLHFLGNDIQPHSFHPGSSPGEILVDESFAQANGFENLRATVALHRGDAHLRHHLDDPFVGRFDEVLHGLIVIDARQLALADHVVEGLESQVGIDGPRAIADQKREMVNLARLAAFQDQTGFRPGSLPNQVMIQPGDGQQRGNRRMIAIHAAIREDDNVVTGGDGVAGFAAKVIQGALQPG